jgi:hypothetical protein
MIPLLGATNKLLDNQPNLFGVSGDSLRVDGGGCRILYDDELMMYGGSSGENGEGGRDTRRE